MPSFVQKVFSNFFLTSLQLRNFYSVLTRGVKKSQFEPELFWSQNQSSSASSNCCWNSQMSGTIQGLLQNSLSPKLSQYLFLHVFFSCSQTLCNVSKYYGLSQIFSCILIPICPYLFFIYDFKRM